MSTYIQGMQPVGQAKTRHLSYRLYHWTGSKAFATGKFLSSVRTYLVGRALALTRSNMVKVSHEITHRRSSSTHLCMCIMEVNVN